MTLPSSPSPITACVPSAASAAPTTPPISACDELDGRPYHQVIRFHAIAPIRPANTIVGVIRSASTMPLATVAATSSEMNAPHEVEDGRAEPPPCGAGARVEMPVATTLAVSWKPFVKSNASAVTTTITSTRSLSIALPPPRPLACVLYDDALEDVRDVLAGVDRLLEPLEDVLPLDHDHRVDAAPEQRRERLARDPVALVLEPVHLDEVVVQVLEPAQPVERLGDVAARVLEHPRRAAAPAPSEPRCCRGP